MNPNPTILTSASDLLGVHQGTLEAAPAVACVEATFEQSQSIPAAETQLATPAPMDGTSAGAEVLSDSEVQRPIAPLTVKKALTFLGVMPDIKDMTIDEKFNCLKQCFAYGYGFRKVSCRVFESICSEFKTYAKHRGEMPTVEEAFKQRGLNYKTVYSAIQREKDRCIADAQFFAEIRAEAWTTNIHGMDADLPPVGEKVVVEDGRKAFVLAHCVTDGGTKTAEVLYEDDGTSEIKKATNLITVGKFRAAKAAARAARKSEGVGNDAAKTVRTEKRKNRDTPVDSFEQIRALALRMLTEGFKVLKPTENPTFALASSIRARTARSPTAFTG